MPVGVIREYHDIPWPPSPLALDVKETTIPKVLYKFLKNLLSEIPEKSSDRTERLALSIGQDLCRAVTAGSWTMPKHILLSVSLHHLFRSKQLITLLNRLGHCENYSYCMELETAHALELEKASTLLTPKIEKGPNNILFHSEWDNFNQNLTGLEGPTTCNTAAGIMLQEVSSHPIICTLAEPVARTGRRSLSTDCHQSLPQMPAPTRSGPSLNSQLKQQPEQNMSAFNQALIVYTLWSFCRQASSLSKQKVPAFGGFVSVTGLKPDRLTTIDFYPSIVEPITEFNVVRELLERCEIATKEVGQIYTITTFDLGFCMKALPLVWDNPMKYKGHIILIGAFHTIMNYLNMLGHKMTGSGYSDILTEANLVSSGCLHKVMHGKKYSKSLWCLKVMSECFERLLIQAFLGQRDDTDSSDADALASLITHLDNDALKACSVDATVQKYILEFQQFQEKVRGGYLGKTAVFWMSFLDHARLVFLLIYAVKVNDFPLFHKCMSDMADLFFSYDGHNYSRYLTWFDVFLTNIETSHPGATHFLKQGAISVARSLIPGSLSAVDKTMEETFMKFAKSRGGSSGVGLTGILQNYGAYQRWIRTSSERCKFYQATLEMTGMASEVGAGTDQHKETRPSQVKKMELAVQRAISAVMGYSNPFDMVDKEKMYILSSGAPVPIDIEQDVLRAEKVGKEKKVEFITNRLVGNGEKNKFFDRITRLKLKKMDICNKKIKLTSKEGKIVQYQEQGNIAFQLLVKSQMLKTPLDINELLKFSLTPVPHSLGTPDGFLAKTNKASLLHYMTDHLPVTSSPSPESTLYIEDGIALVHSLKELPPTFKGISIKILDQLGRKTNFIFSTDMYMPDSIKSQERLRRGCSGKILLEGENTRKPVDFKAFLQNDDNKKQFFQLMHRVWKCDEAASRLLGHSAIIIVEGQAFKMTSVNGEKVVEENISELKSTQVETDTRVVLYLKYALDNGYAKAIVRSPDSDIFFIMMYYAHSLQPLVIYFDTGSGVNRRLMNVTDIALDQGIDMCEAILGYYCYTGEDCTSAFKEKGKVAPFKKLQKNPRYTKAFASLGNSWELEKEMANELERFTCLMYGYPRLQDIDIVRATMLHKIIGGDDILKAKSSKVDLSRFPPCKRSLTPHIRRANYRVGQWKLSHVNDPTHPDPIAHGWKHEEGHLEPVWSEGPIIPESLFDLLGEGQSESSDDEDDAEDSDSSYSSESDTSDMDMD